MEWEALDNAALLRLMTEAEVIGPRAKRLAEAALADAERAGGLSG